MTRPGRPRTTSVSAVPTPLSRYLDANWSKTGLTNDAAAGRFGFTASNLISMWRMGRSAVPLAHLETLADIMSVDVIQLFVLWLKQLRLRDPAVSASLIELLEQRLITKNEAEFVRAIRNATRHADPRFGPKHLAAFAKVASV